MSRFYKSVMLAHRMFEPVSVLCKKPPIILMHGLLDDKDSWEPIPKLLAEATRRRVYTYDARNHGESEDTEDCSFNNNVFDLFHFMDEMEIKDSVLVGNNMGGITAIRAALMQPKRVETAFIVESREYNLPIVRTHFALQLKKLSEEMQRSVDDPQAKLSFYRFPPPYENMLNEDHVKKSVLAFRSAAILEALRQSETSPAMPVDGNYNEVIYFLFDMNSRLFRGEEMDEIMKSLNRYFPRASYETFQEEVFADPELFVHYIALKISSRIKRSIVEKDLISYQKN